MRHGKTGRRLGRKTSHRQAMFRNLVTSFFDHEKITTTDAKAKEIRSIAEKMITFGKRGDLHSIRLAASFIREKSIVTKLFNEIAPRYKERNGGYTRIIKLGIRQGDNASLSILQLVEQEFTPKAKSMSPISTKLEKTEVVVPAEVEAVTVTAVLANEEVCEAKAD